MVALIAVPAALTLATVRHPPGAVPPSANPTPHGYTVSLLIFLVPVLVIGLWHIIRPRHPVERTALLLASGTVTTLGVILDFWFGHTFFTFPNEGATLNLRLPAWDLAQGMLVHQYLPIEEYAFYILSGLFMIMIYLWADAHWLGDYTPDDFSQQAQAETRLLDFHFGTFAVCLALIAGGWIFKKYGPSDTPEGFPGYFTFQVILAFLPTMVCINCVRRFINWRAFGFSYFMLLLVSLVWEATLGVPYGWWDYKREQMLGIHILAWGRLPIEAVLLWLVAGWGAIISFEFWRVFLHMKRPARNALIGVPAPRKP
jgi:hypothetical protein